ncbi:MAG: YfiR family protein [Verrucomicrobia bacterium]|nr:YfiR family protein [Verrucomicrobiota bacterium]
MELLGTFPTSGSPGTTVRAVVARIVFAVLAWPAVLFGAPAREYQVKAVFLFNFAQFVEWPPEAFENPRSPIVIGVLGSDPFGSLLEDAVHGETAQGRPLQVRRFSDPRAAQGCHILFLSAHEAAKVPETLAALKGRPVLTVGESEGFAVSGGMIRFVMDRGKIRLRINANVARDAGLTLSSKLLRPAQIVDSGDAAP